MNAADLHACIVERYNVTNGMANCPAHDDRTPSLSVTLDGDRVLVHCHAGCSQADVLDAMRRDGVWPEAGAGLGRYIEPVLRPAPETPVSYPWWSPDRREPVIQVRPGRNGRKYDWPLGTKPKRLLFPCPLPPGDSPVIISEGAKAAGHAGRKSGLPAVAIVSESIIPDDDVLRDAGVPGRQVWLWPDVGGEVVMNRLAPRLAELGCDVHHLHPEVLGLRTKGDDAEQWQPGSDPLGELRAALREHAAADKPLMQPAGEWVAACRQPADRELTAAAPGLLYRGRAVLLHQKRGGGKSTYAAWAAASASREGLRVALLVDDDERTWADRLVEFGADLARIAVGTMRAVADAGLERAVEGADVLILDSWRRWSTACGVRGKGALNDESLVGPVIDALVDVAHGRAVAVLVLANQPKDGDTARGSFSLEDAVDAVRTIQRNGQAVTISTAEKRRHGLPEGPWTLTLGAAGFASGGDGGSSAGALVPGTAESRYEDAAYKWLMDNGEASGTTIAKRTPGRASEIRDALQRLLAMGRVTRRDDGRGGTIWAAVAAPVPESEHLYPGTAGTAPVPVPVPANGNAPGTGGTTPVPEAVPKAIPEGSMGTGGTGGTGAVPVPVPGKHPGRIPDALTTDLPVGEYRLTDRVHRQIGNDPDAWRGPPFIHVLATPISRVLAVRPPQTADELRDWPNPIALPGADTRWRIVAAALAGPGVLDVETLH